MVPRNSWIRLTSERRDILMSSVKDYRRPKKFYIRGIERLLNRPDRVYSDIIEADDKAEARALFRGSHPLATIVQVNERLD